jgi:hypothetical protein
VKVHYLFDKDSQVYLARWPQILSVQTIQLEENSAIGMVDLKLCLRAVEQCSPELFGHDGDYTVYAFDYSEPDTPLVGQGMLSWILETDGDNQSMVTGRVTKNMLAMFSKGIKETLEVKLKLTATGRIQRRDLQRNDSQRSIDMSQSRSAEQAMTPTGTSEWTSFIQSNPQIGHTGNVARIGSPAFGSQMRTDDIMVDSRRQSFGSCVPIAPQQSSQPQFPASLTPTTTSGLIDGRAVKMDESRPSSRASKRSRGPTGRPRGRPRKKVGVEGNTSGYEDATDGDDGPSRKKRARPTKADKNISVPFGGLPESLRVAASTSGSLRNFRPIAAAGSDAQGNHLQEVPRAPTPIPDLGANGMPGRVGPASKLRRQSTMSQETTPFCPMAYNEPTNAISPSQDDGRSPQSLAQSPIYSEDSPQDIRSSPPVPRGNSFVRSSPAPSSPILPPMPMPQPDSGFMSGGVDELFEAEEPRPLPEKPAPEVRPQPKSRKKKLANIPLQIFRVEQVKPITEPVVDPNMEALFNKSRPTSHPTDASRIPQPPAHLNRSYSAPNAIDQPIPQGITKPADPRASFDAGSGLNQVNGERDFAQILMEAVDRANNSKPSTPAPEEPSLPPPKTGLEPPPTFAAPKPRNPLHRSMSIPLPLVPASDPVSAPILALPTIPASDPVGPLLALPTLPPAPASEAPCPPSDAVGPAPPTSPQAKSNKNLVKKQSIKLRLEKAVAMGEMPPFCHNCGAIETPTWRKIWTQDCCGIPPPTDLSDKPGKVTTIEVLEKDEHEVPIKYRVVKKALAPTDDRRDWVEALLCNRKLIS